MLGAQLRGQLERALAKVDRGLQEAADGRAEMARAQLPRVCKERPGPQKKTGTRKRH